MSARARAVAAVLAAGAVVVAAAGWARFADRDRWLSLPRRMPVVDASGAPLELLGPASDIHLGFVQDGDTLWTMARSEGAKHLVRYDLATRRGEARWPLPPSHQWSKAFLPGEGGRFGYVFRADSGLYAAVGDERGWRQGPERIAEQDYPLIGTAWAGDRFEVVVNQIEDGWRVLSLDAEPRRLDAAARAALRRHLFGDGEPSGLWGLDAAAYHDGETWWLQFADRRGTGVAGHAVSEHGEVVALERAPPGVHEADRTALGLLNALGFGDQRVTADGRAVPPPALETDDAPFPGQYVVEGGELGLRQRWWLGGWFAYTAADGRLFGVDVNRGQVLVGGHLAPRRAVSRDPGSTLGHDPAVIPGDRGGLLLVAQDGYYLELDRDWQRADAPGWREHLTSFPGERARLRPWFLSWILAGPLAAFGPALVAWLARRRSRRLPAQPPRWPPARLLLWGAGLYVITAGLALRELWPLLR